MWSICLTDDSQEISRLSSLKNLKVKLFSAAVVIGALRVKWSNTLYTLKIAFLIQQLICISVNP